MNTQNFTKEEYAQGFAICGDCERNIRTLQAGYDAKRTICDKCDCSVVSLSEWDKTIEEGEK